MASSPSIKKLKKETVVTNERKTEMVDEMKPNTGNVLVSDKAKSPDQKEQTKETEKEKTDKTRDSPKGDSLENSVASAASTASAERRFIPAAGREGKSFESVLLSAIREAIFFPKKALTDRQQGEVAVSFVSE